MSTLKWRNGGDIQSINGEAANQSEFTVHKETTK